VRYLYEQAENGDLPNVTDGQELLNALIAASSRGMEAIKNVCLGESATQEDMMSLLGKFGIALYASDSSLTESDSAAHFRIDAIRLRSRQDDNRSTSLTGPTVEELTDSGYDDDLVGTSFRYLYIPHDVLQNWGHEIHVESSDTDSVGFSVIANHLE
jgi:hypothetical protein